jgi:hypothetical protein
MYKISNTNPNTIKEHTELALRAVMQALYKQRKLYLRRKSALLEEIGQDVLNYGSLSDVLIQTHQERFDRINAALDDLEHMTNSIYDAGSRYL